MSTTRKPGFYWVCQYNTTPEIAFFWGKCWTVNGNDNLVKESVFEYIYTEPIKTPTFEELKKNSL